VHLHTLSNDKPALPPCAENRRVWLTRPIGSGSSGDVWQCHFDGTDTNTSFAIKIVEVLRPSDEDRRRRLHNEFNFYLLLEDAHASKKLFSRIAPRCYGAFESDYLEVIVLDLCDSTLTAWDELSASER
jgi:hypothetical protein